MDQAELLQVIRTTLLRRGEGKPLDPIRVITQYWAVGGQLLAEVDPHETHWLCKCRSMHPKDVGSCPTDGKAA
jgi:hypothetical protein